MSVARSFIVSILCLFAGLAAGPALGQWAFYYADDQITELIAGSRVTATGTCTQISDGEPGDLTLDFVFDIDGTFTVDFDCGGEPGNDVGKWRVRYDTLCLGIKDTSIAAFFPWGDDCYSVAYGKYNFALYATGTKFLDLSISHPKHASDDALLSVMTDMGKARRQAEAVGSKESGAAEIKRLKLEAEEARKAEAVQRARAAAELKARETEIARLKRQAEEARKTDVARLKQEVEEALRKREEKRTKVRPFFADIHFGRYHALVIGINDYMDLPRLTTAINDAHEVARVLEDDYGFQVTLLTNPDRREIVDALDVYAEKLGPDDNLLIYYAGHGWLNEEADRGYWLPVDAKPKRRSGWVSNATITDTLKVLSAKHVMVVADSCYSGTLVRSADVATRTRTGDYWKQMAETVARVAITSGGLEPVADKGGGNHSPFAKAFIDILRSNDGVMDGTQLFSKMRRPVMVAAQQTPQYSDVREAGHDGGDFLFVRRK